MKMCPPSRTGIGSRFSNPRFRLIDAIRLKSATHPSCADSPESCAMATGPISCRGDVSSVNRPHSVWMISPDHSMFFLTLISTASTGPGLIVLKASWIPMPIQPFEPCFTVLTVIVIGVPSRRMESVIPRFGFFAMASRSCVENVIGSPSTATI